MKQIRPIENIRAGTKHHPIQSHHCSTNRSTYSSCPPSLITGSGKSIFSKTTGASMAHKVSPVVVSFKPTMAMMSPACASLISSRLLECIKTIRPMRSLLLLLQDSSKGFNWLVVSTPLKNISQNGNLPQIGLKIKNI